MVQLETIFNRARARGQSLDEVTQQYTGPGSKGYYPASTFSGGRITSLAEYQKFQRDIMAPALAGSDVSTERLGFPATGNASDQPGNEVASHGIASGKYTRHGMLGPKTYVQEGHSGSENILRLERSRVNRDLISAPQKVEGDAHLRVAFENAPAGAKAYMKYGGLFKSGTVDWGHPMPASPPGGAASFSERWPDG